MCIDPVLKLGWINSGEGLALARRLADKAEKNARTTQSEADTVAVFVEPILRGLGWDTLTWAEVSRESRRKYPLGDLWLLAKKGTKIAVIIEVKQIGLPTFTETDRMQLEVYARKLVEAKEGPTDPENNWKRRLEDGGRVFLHGVLTNGQKWEIYEFRTQKADTEAPSISRKLLYKFDLATAKEGLTELSSYIGKDAIESKVREFLLRGDCADSGS